ncbi:hypothetical protein Dtox_1665 [Desulfofarcimen acetoxidans DSM 771]|uniref:Uncharacterized protein n=1 Tax=Desulfofarcimen acetoxidans (strain ATCC 49208 / DSM 771 / KCTC 5769 / VKM B-1644 / 5575) TaxID=485916 RepID=C8VWH0_DESAS|nr:hypothetical protein [Desulfofarcimen acetoxidans]ACV62522.1 hypothetical protein Dtox_1665 [Desulfofarcimen acetoxidans DSM 771]
MRCVDDFRCARCLKDKEYIEFDYNVFDENSDLWLDFCVECDVEEKEAEEFATQIFSSMSEEDFNMKYRSKKWQEHNKLK